MQQGRMADPLANRCEAGCQCPACCTLYVTKGFLCKLLAPRAAFAVCWYASNLWTSEQGLQCQLRACSLRLPCSTHRRLVE